MIKKRMYLSYSAIHIFSVFVSSVITILIINPSIFIEYLKIIEILIVPFTVSTMIIIDQFEIIYHKTTLKNQSFINIKLYFALFMKTITIFIFSLPILTVAIFIFSGAVADSDGCRPFYKCTNWKDSLLWTAQVGLVMYPYLLVFALLIGYLDPLIRYQLGKYKISKS